MNKLTTFPAPILPADSAKGKAWSEFEAEAAARQSGRALTGPLLSATEAQLTAADLNLTARCDPAAKLAQQDHFFRLYGVRRGDDRRSFVG